MALNGNPGQGQAGGSSVLIGLLAALGRKGKNDAVQMEVGNSGLSQTARKLSNTLGGSSKTPGMHGRAQAEVSFASWPL